MFKKIEDNPNGQNYFSLEHKKESPGAWINPQSYKRYNKEISPLCSGGANVWVVKSTGEIFRCFHDLNPISHINSFPNGMFTKCERCTVGHICSDSGDRMKSTRYFETPEDKEKYMGYKNNPVATRWQESLNPNDLKMNFCHFDLCPTYVCQFRCPPCCNYFPINNEPRKVVKGELKIEEYKIFYNKLKNNFDKVDITLIGGEPTLYAHIDELIQYGSDLGFYGSIVSNFSSENKMEKISKINFSNPELFSFSISIHPFEENIKRGYSFERIIKYAKLFKNRGHKVRACLLAWPSILKYWEEYKPIMKKLDIPFFLKPVGGYDGIYTQENKKYIYEQGGYRETCSFLEEINWVKKDWN